MQKDHVGIDVYTSGSGKLKDIEGKGTFTCAPSGDGTSCEVERGYQLTK